MPSFLGVEEDDGEDKPDGETDERKGVLTIGAKHPVWTKRAPEDGSGEEGIDTGTSHLEWRRRGTESVDLVHLEVEDSDTDE